MEFIKEIKFNDLINETGNQLIKKMQLYTKPANLQKYLGVTLNNFEQNIKRAEIVKQIVNEK